MSNWYIVFKRRLVCISLTAVGGGEAGRLGIGRPAMAKRCHSGPVDIAPDTACDITNALQNVSQGFMNM